MTAATPVQGVRTGTVGAYMTSGDAQAVRRVRDIAGHVTVSGKAGLRALRQFAADGHIDDVDLDPATYLDREPDQALMPIDWVEIQRDLGLPIIRSAGLFARRNDPASLREAMAAKVAPDAFRVISLSSFWLKKDRISSVATAFRNSDNHLTLVLADQFDPLHRAEQVECLRQLIEVCTVDGRRLELLRTDTHAIGFAASGGTHGAIGLTSNGRHHPQPMKSSARAEHEQRQKSPLIWTPALMSWQRGIRLGALEPFNGAGYTDCLCSVCDGRSLLRFNHEWPQVPANIRLDAQLHDVSSWAILRNRILTAPDPTTAWSAATRAAARASDTLIQTYRISGLSVTDSLQGWA